MEEIEEGAPFGTVALPLSGRRAILKGLGAVALLPLASSASTSASRAPAIVSRPPDPTAGQADPAVTLRGRWVAMAESLKPVLRQTTQSPVAIVRATSDKGRYLRWCMDIDAPGADLPNRLLHKGDSFILDFEGHRAGYFHFLLIGEGRTVDSPVRLKLTFGEVAGDVAEPLYPYRGSLSSAWLPEEIITVDFLPQEVKMPRRYAFRYVKVEVVDTSPNFGIRFHNASAVALTSSSEVLKPLPAGVPDWVRRVDEVSTATLRDCMQTIFEDGPRRDQRLWVGDLRLQARASYVTFPNHDLVKRCLYLFAGLPRETDGFMPACIFEKPTPITTATFILDYAALYGAILLDYLHATKDVGTVRELWPVALQQIDLLFVDVDEGGIFRAPPGSWSFIDWSQHLDRSAAMQGVMIYGGRRLCELGTALGETAATSRLTPFLDAMSSAGRKLYYSSERGVCVSGPKDQVSWASQAWLTLAGCLTKEEAARALRRAVLEDKTAVQPSTAYLYHHVVEAMVEAGMKAEALELVRSYWGGMVNAGADTFWEAYDPDDSRYSPYGDVHINSFCHAWSCTPAYFFRALNLTG